MKDVKDLNHCVRLWLEKYYDIPVDDEKLNKRVEIDWHKVNFTADTPDFTMTRDGEEDALYDMYGEEQQEANGGNQEEEGEQDTDMVSTLVFRSNYVNNTKETQEHTFVMERTTSAVVTTSLTEGFSRSGYVGVKIAVPSEVSNLTGDYGSEILIQSEDDSAVTHSLTWSTNSKVRAPPEKKTVAVLTVNEKQYHCDFSTNIKFRGRVLVKVRESSDAIAPIVREGDIGTILSDLQKNGLFNPGKGVVKFHDVLGSDKDSNGEPIVSKKKVTWKMTGKLKFRFGVSQDVKVGYKPLTSRDRRS